MAKNDKKRIGTFLLQHRKWYTAEALQRTSVVNNNGTVNTIKVLRAMARIAFNKPAMATVIEGETDKTGKETKDVMSVLGPLSREPFPLIETKKMDKEGGELRSASLYSMASGRAVAKRYSSAQLSELGRYLMRYERYNPIESLNSFNSIIPMMLLTSKMPFTTGLKGRSFPLNPEELFKLQIAMIEKGTYNLDSDIVKSIFRGYDLGDGYICLMTDRALQTLYTRGFGSLIAVPEVEIDRQNKTIIFKVPPHRGSGVGFKHTLLDENKKRNPFKTFTYSNDIDVLGKGVILKVLEFNTPNDIDIINELYNNRLVYRKENTKFYNVIYDSEKVAQAKESSDVEELENIEKEAELEEARLETAAQNDQGLKEIEAQVSKALQYEDVNHNLKVKKDYGFALDIVPVYKELWRCINAELREKKKDIEREIESLKYQLKVEMLLEKVTRPIVNDKISEINKLGDNATIALQNYYKPGAQTELPEGFDAEEAEMIYSDTKIRGYNFMVVLYKREKYKDLFQATKSKIEALLERLNNPQTLLLEIKKDLEYLINTGRYARKSQVLFKAKNEPGKNDLTQIFEKDVELVEPIDIQEYILEREILPCTVFYNATSIVKVYGANCIFYKDKRYRQAYNLTNNESLLYIYNDSMNGLIKQELISLKSLPLYKERVLSGNFMGLLPYNPAVTTLAWTNKGRYIAYSDKLNVSNLYLDEVFIGWEQIDANDKYLDILAKSGLTRVEIADSQIQEILIYKDKLEIFPIIMDELEDIVAHSDESNKFHIWRFKGDTLFRDDAPVENKLPKKLHTKLIDIKIDLPVFSEHLELYVNGIYIKNQKMTLGVTSHEYGRTKHMYVKEKTILTSNDRISNAVKKQLYNLNTSPALLTSPNNLLVLSRTSKLYMQLDKSLVNDQDIIDTRLVEPTRQNNKTNKTNIENSTWLQNTQDTQEQQVTQDVILDNAQDTVPNETNNNANIDSTEQ